MSILVLLFFCASCDILLFSLVLVFFFCSFCSKCMLIFAVIESLPWRDINQNRKMQYMFRLLDKLETVSVDERRNTARSILYLCQGKFYLSIDIYWQPYLKTINILYGKCCQLSYMTLIL